MLHIAICDDDEKMVESVRKDISILLREKSLAAEITAYTKGRQMQYDIQEGRFFDLALCDIEMPDISGMELVSYMKSYLPDILVIFITAHLQYAIDAFELDVFRYIPKDSFRARFRHAFEDAVQMIQMQAGQYYTVHMPGRLGKIRYRRILYIRRDGKYASITLTDGDTLRVRKTLAQVYKELGSGDFAYASRGDIVNLCHVMGIIDVMVEMEGGTRILASHAKLRELKERLNDFWGCHI